MFHANVKLIFPYAGEMFHWINRSLRLTFWLSFFLYAKKQTLGRLTNEQVFNIHTCTLTKYLGYLRAILITCLVFHPRTSLRKSPGLEHALHFLIAKTWRLEFQILLRTAVGKPEGGAWQPDQNCALSSQPRAPNRPSTGAMCLLSLNLLF